MQGSIKDPEQGYWRPSQIGRESVRKGGHDIEVKESVKVDPDSNAFDDDGHVLRTGTATLKQACRHECIAQHPAVQQRRASRAPISCGCCSDA